MTLDFGTGPFVVSKVEIYLEDNRDTSRLDATYFPRGNFPLSFVISSMLLFRSILRFGSGPRTEKRKKVSRCGMKFLLGSSLMKLSISI